MIKHKFLVVLFALILILTIIGCIILLPPTAYAVQTFLQKNREDIETVVDYLMEMQTDYACIDSDDGSIMYDGYVKDGEGKDVFKVMHETITSDETISSIRRLWKAGCRMICKDDDENTIYIEIWRSTVRGRSCGLARTINRKGMPMAPLQTKCKEIKDGWFYYYSDYEEWRLDPDKYRELFRAD